MIKKMDVMFQIYYTQKGLLEVGDEKRATYNNVLF